MIDKGKPRDWAIALLALIFFFAAQYAILGKIELCVFRSISGLPCPGCGMTHAATAIFHGNWRQSLEYHLFFIPVAATLLFCAVPTGAWSFADTVKRCHKWHSFLLLALAVYFIYRLVRYFPGESYPMIYDARNYLHALWEKLFCAN